MRGESLDHVLLHGPPGLGKTTLAAVIANEMGVNMRITSGPTIEKAGDLAALLTNLQENDILFVDEIHRMNRAVEEILYPAMEDFAIDIIIGKGPSANSIRLDLPKFTLIGATTRSGQLSAPLRDRFGVILRLELYSPEELRRIVERSAGILGIEIDSAGADEIARRSRGTPRIANRILRRVRDFAQVTANGRITRDVADKALNRLEIDHLGLDALDRRMLSFIPADRSAWRRWQRRSMKNPLRLRTSMNRIFCSRVFSRGRRADAVLHRRRMSISVSRFTASNSSVCKLHGDLGKIFIIILQFS